jgi:hypothetical protein
VSIAAEEVEVFEEAVAALPVRRSTGEAETERTGAALEDEAEVAGTCLPLRRWVKDERVDMRMSVNKNRMKE